MKKVVFFTYGMKFGGVEKVIATLANYLSSKNVKCYIITLINEPCAYEINNDITLISLNKQNGSPKGLRQVLAYIYLRKNLKKINPDVLVSMPEEVSGKAIAALLGLKIPIIVSERNNPWIMPRNKANRILRKIFYPFAKGVVFQTEQASMFFSKNIRKKSIVIPNPIDLSRLPKEINADKRNEIVTIGRLEEQKNHKLMINAFKIFYETHPNYKLIIYGDGSLRSELEEYANNHLENDSFSFMGTKTNVLDLINGSSLFVLSSNYEGMPNALMEAMAMGLPVVSTDCPSGGPASLIENMHNGILVLMNDEKGLAASMKKVIDNPELAIKLSVNAVSIKESLNSEVILEKWRKYLDAICNKDSKA